MALFIDFNEFVVRPEFHTVVYPRMRHYLMTDVRDMIRKESRDIKSDLRRELPTMINTELNSSLRGKIYDIVFNSQEIQQKINSVKDQVRRDVDNEAKQVVDSIVSTDGYHRINQAFFDEVRRKADSKLSQVEIQYKSTVDNLTRENTHLKQEINDLKDQSRQNQVANNRNLFFTTCVAVGGFAYALMKNSQ